MVTHGQRARRPRDGLGHRDRPGGGLAVRRARLCRHGQLLEVEGRGRGDRRRRPLARGRGAGRPAPTSPTTRRSARWSQRTVEAFGGLDVLVNNAATTHFVPHTDLEGLTEPGLGRDPRREPEGDVLRLPGGDAAPEGAARATSSTSPRWRGSPGSGSSIAYAASKGAVITLTKSLARAFAPEVRVNAVAPGPVQTRWLADHQDMVDQAMKLTPLKRPATPDDIADVARLPRRRRPP